MYKISFSFALVTACFCFEILDREDEKDMKSGIRLHKLILAQQTFNETEYTFKIISLFELSKISIWLASDFIAPACQSKSIPNVTTQNESKL
jgi:hypothetical protein